MRPVFRARTAFLLLLVVVLALAACAPRIDRTGPADEPDGAYRQQTWGVPFQTGGGANGQILAATVYFPRNATPPYPLVVLSHGSPRGSARPTVYYRAQSAWFADKGYLVVVPMRRGYGRSHGNWSEGFGPCRLADYESAGRATAEDILSTVRYFQAQDFVDPGRIVLAGQSAGGFGSIAAASERPRGVLGVVNFSGGRGSIRRYFNCSPEALVEAAGAFGQTTAVPSIWIYTTRDNYFGPELSRAMYDAFDAVSPSDSAYHLLDGYGHSLFSREYNIDAWAPLVEAFLAKVDPANAAVASLPAK